ncbi:hypothetical protein PBAL39_20610 [Pedobacter sp. BAL39]|uniref:hypothetical protein n=1 Tax=Pedobacter sp. BAL39 TaxID=391596 RepID=UPI000155936F|nr:hypothetical protein [Pedobacter sp. BAL39]EDM38513.1 hypothetical protein PBAL39_20610 [Pedobacter sp. BAL39]
MIKIEILPLDGIEIDNIGKLSLGQSKSDIEKLLGSPSESSNLKQLFYDEYEFRIDLDSEGNSEFIEFLYGPFPEKTELSIYGHNPFQIGANKLIQILTEKNDGEIDDSEADYCYAFLNISVGIWRQLTEKTVEESIAEMKADNEYKGNQDWLNEDLNKAKNFWTIGIGVKNYYE